VLTERDLLRGAAGPAGGEHTAPSAAIGPTFLATGGGHTFLATGDPEPFARLAERFLGRRVPVTVAGRSTTPVEAARPVGVARPVGAAR